MEQLRRTLDWAVKSDPLVSWGERLGRLLVWLAGPSISAVLLGGLGLVIHGLFYGALFGLAAFALTQLGLTLWLFRRQVVGASPTPQPTPTDADSPPSQGAEAQQTQQGLPMDMIAERHIRYHEIPIPLADLLEVAGENGVLRGFSFEHCILEGPGIINLEAPFPDPKTTASGSSAGMSLALGPTHCRVEGSPDTTLYQITRNGKMPVGVIHLPGYTLRAVTFRNLGFVGSRDHLEWLKRHLLFSEGSSNE